MVILSQGKINSSQPASKTEVRLALWTWKVEARTCGKFRIYLWDILASGFGTRTGSAAQERVRYMVVSFQYRLPVGGLLNRA